MVNAGTVNAGALEYLLAAGLAAFTRFCPQKCVSENPLNMFTVLD
jgi:hypothetical protein